MSREMKDRNQSFYTIASAGHEQNAVLGAQLRLSDPCFLHYRSGGLMMARAAGSTDPIERSFRALLSHVRLQQKEFANGH